MNDFKESLSKLLPIIIDANQFNAPKNREKIDEEVKNLYEISKQVVHSPTVKNLDPSVKFISKAFSDDLYRANESLAADKREYARYTLLNVTAYCIECHTRTSSGPSFNTPQLENALQKLKPIGRGEYLLATRNFDRAFAEFKNVIRDSLAINGNLFELDRAVLYALSISVKFQNDPKKSLEISELVEKSDRAPYYLKQSAKAWSQSIKDWMKEKPTRNSKPDDFLKRSTALVNAGRTAQQGFGDRGGDVYFLRAVSGLNGLLIQPLNPSQLGQALYLTGVSNEAIRDMSPVPLYESYFESCIRQVPHSSWSEKCYTKLEESIYFGYTGSSGLRLPEDVQQKLQELQKLALPETPAAPKK